jgi:hypothetical protein
MMDDSNLNAEPAGGDKSSDAVEARRKLLKLGVYAAYTAPILLAMATSAKAQPSSATVEA